MLSTLVLPLLLAGLAFPAASSRGEALESIAGWEGDSRDNGYGFAEAGTHLAITSHVMIPIGVSISYLYYHYDSAGVDIAVRSPGASLMTGLRVAGPRGSISAMGGGELRWEHRDTETPGTVQRTRTTSGVVLQTYGDLALARRIQASEFAVYVGTGRYLLGRGTLRFQVTNADWKRPTTFYLGVEGGGQGNAESQGFQGGGLAEWILVPRQVSLGLHSGYKESWSPGWPHERGGYLGVSLYHRF
jgi:cellulose biosynthesis protein BcsS